MELAPVRQTNKTMEIKGKLIKKYDIQQGTTKAGKLWKKQDIVIQEQEGDYPNCLAIAVFGDAIDKLPPVNSEVVAKFNSKCNDYNEKAINNLSLWKLDVVRKANPFG